MNELSLIVVGLDFPKADDSDRRFEMALCRPGGLNFLDRESTNRADRRDVMVLSERWIQLGYLTAERCQLIARRLNRAEEYRAIFQAAGTSWAVTRLRFGGGDPALPRHRTQSHPEP